MDDNPNTDPKATKTGDRCSEPSVAQLRLHLLQCLVAISIDPRLEIRQSELQSCILNVVRLIRSRCFTYDL